VTREEVRRFHADVYGPETLVLAVAGQVDAEKVHATFEQLLEGWQAADPRPSAWPDPEPCPPGEERIPLPDRPNLDLLLGHRARLLRHHPDYPAAVLANSCLGQSTLTSRLGAVVRDQEGLTYGVFSRFFGTLRIPGPWAIFLTVSPRDLERAAELCRGLVRDYLRTGPDEAELAGERRSLAGSYRVGLSTMSSVARELVTLLSSGLPVSSLDDYPRQLLECDADAVREAVQRHFHPDEISLAVAGTFSEGSS
jgi:zinc protease